MSIYILGCSNTDIKKEQNDNIAHKETNYTKGKIHKISRIKYEDEGITQTIEEVGVFNNMTDASEIYKVCKDVINDKNKDKVTVVVKFKIENDNDFPISSYTSVRPFVTNTGEIGDLIEEGTYDTEINSGETNEGYAVFNLTKTSVDELKSLKMWWIVGHTYGESDDKTTIDSDDFYAHDNKFDIELK
jgi:hypothetical protein